MLSSSPLTLGASPVLYLPLRIFRNCTIVQAQKLLGDPDYLLMVVTADLPAFQRLYDEALSRLPNVQRLTSTSVMKHIITDRSLPLD
ncbi:Lrp/AsnC ligand binding domain-containing protein [Pseudomonas sp. CFBP 13727]|nr:Lrp/AsnC ligand binding domain-containing protein [Pseudomonas sp. CFBP 13727]